MRATSLHELDTVLESIAPLRHSATWDNTGWIVRLENPQQIRGVLLCIDLTTAVVTEAVARSCQAVVCYHPPIFHPLKRLEATVGMHAALQKALAHGIHLYSPHTALDSASNGLNDWLAGLAGPGSIEAFASHGARLVTLTEPVSLRDLCLRYLRALRAPCIRLVLGRGISVTTKARELAVCAGSGASALREVRGARVWLTGEMSHHDLLSAREAGVTVLLSEHTRTERPYLPRYAERIRRAAGSRLRVLVSRHDAEIVDYLVEEAAAGSSRRKTR